MSTTIQNLMAKKAELVAEMRAVGASALKEAFKELFDKHPECQAIRWRQYTPYWNDGEPCEFGVNDFFVKLEGSDEEDGDYEDGFVYPSSRSDSEHKALFAAVRELARLDEEVYEMSFGDHVCVTATREGFEVEEYEHE